MDRQKENRISRRDFLKRSAAITGAAAGAVMLGGLRSRDGSSLLQAQERGVTLPDLAAVRGGEPDVMFDRGIAALGGMESFVGKRDTVVIKPNMAWDRGPETGANTNPLLIKRIVEHAFNAGAGKVYVFDHAVSAWERVYKASGIKQAAEEAGATVVPANSNRYYETVTVPGGRTLTSTAVHELILESDVFINVPVLKHHNSARLTMAMKNLMGVVWNRGFYHSRGLNQCIADFPLFRAPDLNVLDAYVVTLRHGPGYAGPGDIVKKKNLILSPDIVAVDTAGTLIFGEKPDAIRYINMAHRHGLGTMDLDSLNIERIAL